MSNENLETTPSLASPSPDNRPTLHALFGLGNNSPASNPDPPPPPTTMDEALVQAVKKAQQAAQDASNQVKAVRQAAEDVRKQADDIRDTATAIDRIQVNTDYIVQTIMPQVEKLTAWVNRTEQLTQETRNKVEELTDQVETSERHTHQDRNKVEELIAQVETSARHTYQNRLRVEELKDQAEEAARGAGQAKTEAEDAKEQAKLTLRKVEKIRNEIFNRTGSPPCSPPGFSRFRDFLDRHKFKFLWGAIALVPLLFLLYRWLTPPPQSAQTLFVNPTSGNDENNKGSSTTPFKTLPHAIQQAGPGSTIYLSRGIFPIDQAMRVPANTTLVTQFFKDLDGHWAAPFINALATKGLVAGHEDNTFRPNDTLTRAQYATWLVKAFNLPPSASPQPFEDVKSDYWAYDAIQRTYAAQYLAGPYPGRLIFQPNDTIQRVEVIATLVSGLKLQPGQVSSIISYQDQGAIPGWASNQVATATSRGLIVNVPNPQTLNPKQNATRAEAAAMIYQALRTQDSKLPAITSPYIVNNQ